MLVNEIIWSAVGVFNVKFLVDVFMVLYVFVLRKESILYVWVCARI